MINFEFQAFKVFKLRHVTWENHRLLKKLVYWFLTVSDLLLLNMLYSSQYKIVVFVASRGESLRELSLQVGTACDSVPG